jgi:hypothetical protein
MIKRISRPGFLKITSPAASGIFPEVASMAGKFQLYEENNVII